MPPSEQRWVEIFFKPLEFGFDFGFGMDLGVEKFHAGGGGRGADDVESGFVARDKFDERGLSVVGELVGIA